MSTVAIITARGGSKRPRRSMRGSKRRAACSDVLRIGLVLFDVAVVLPLVVNLVFFQVGLVDIVRRHAERLRQ